MYNTKNAFVIRIIAMLMVMVLMVPVGARAATQTPVQPYASYYLSSYAAYVYIPGGGQVQVYFNVEGTGYMDEIGSLFIELYESVDGSNWSCVKTFNHYSRPGMLSYNDDYHSGSVTYYGIPGRYYKAYVCVWAGKNGSGDNRYFWTSVKQ